MGQLGVALPYVPCPDFFTFWGHRSGFTGFVAGLYWLKSLVGGFTLGGGSRFRVNPALREGFVYRTTLIRVERGSSVDVYKCLSDWTLSIHQAAHLPQPFEPDGELPDVQDEEDGSGEKESCTKAIA